MDIPLDYRDSRANYISLPYYRRYEKQPENEPMLVPGEAPFPLWIVPTAWRMARFSDIAKAAGTSVTAENIGELLSRLGVNYSASAEGIHAWGFPRPFAIWRIQGTGDSIAFWQLGPLPPRQISE